MGRMRSTQESHDNNGSKKVSNPRQHSTSCSSTNEQRHIIQESKDNDNDDNENDYNGSNDEEERTSERNTSQTDRILTFVHSRINQIHQLIQHRRQKSEQRKRQKQAETIVEQLTDNSTLGAVHNPRVRPPPLSSLAASTGLTQRQLKWMYSEFKTQCPNGLMSKSNFQKIFGYFFPLGEANLFAGLLFESFMKFPKISDLEDYLCFDQFVQMMSLLSKGTVLQKMDWLFILYDVDKDGVISKQDLQMVLAAVYDLCGTTHCRPCILPNTASKAAEQLFPQMDQDSDGKISKDDFEKFLIKKLSLNNKKVTDNTTSFFLTSLDPLMCI